MERGLDAAVAPALSSESRELSQRLEHLGRGLQILMGLMGLGLIISGGIRAIRELNSQPNSSLVVLLIGLGFLALAPHSARAAGLDGTNARTGLRRMHALAWQIPLALIAAFLTYRLQVQDIKAYAQLFAEGSVAEWLTFLLFVVSAPVAMACGLASWKHHEHLRAGHHLVFSLACLFVALEEMSWGQMVFNWPTPGLLNEHNAQHETSLHNLHVFQDNLWSGTALVIGCTVVLSLLRVCLLQLGALKRDGLLRDLLPGPEVLPCLCFALVIYVPVAMEKAGLNLPVLITRDQEVGELAFGLACLLYTTRLYLAQPIRWQRQLSTSI